MRIYATFSLIYKYRQNCSLYSIMCVNDMRLSDLARNLLSRWTLVVGIFCGCAGVFTDIDHPLAYLFFQEASRRFLHKPVFIISSIVLCVLIAYCGGLYCSLVLKRKKK